jgi:predicted TIM-barrel fold metal-dependent hydrolase
VLEEWQWPSAGRIVGAVIVPLWDAALAAEEVRRTAHRGARAVAFTEIPAWLGLPSMYSREWDPFLEACQETQMVINVHIGSAGQITTSSVDAPPAVGIANYYVNSSLSLTDWLLCGAFARFPRLKVAFSEGQAGWLPYLANRLDGMWRGGKAFNEVSDRLPQPPSVYLPTNVFLCVFDDPSALAALDFIGDDNLLFETDYPHADGSWPDSRSAAWRQTGSWSKELREKVIQLNGRRLLGIE